MPPSLILAHRALAERHLAIVLPLPLELLDLAVSEHPDLVAHGLDEVPIVADDDDAARELRERDDDGIDGLNVEVV